MTLATEHQEQAAVIQWCDRHPVAKWIFAVPNGAKKSMASAVRFKKEGLRKGVPDLFLLVPRLQYAGLVIEMKRSKGGVVSLEQREWLNFLGEQGYKCAVCRGYDEAILALTEYLGA